MQILSTLIWLQDLSELNIISQNSWEWNCIFKLRKDNEIWNEIRMTWSSRSRTSSKAGSKTASGPNSLSLPQLNVRGSTSPWRSSCTSCGTLRWLGSGKNWNHQGILEDGRPHACSVQLIRRRLTQIHLHLHTRHLRVAGLRDIRSIQSHQYQEFVDHFNFIFRVWGEEEEDHSRLY